jgi:hypothetical protein
MSRRLAKARQPAEEFPSVLIRAITGLLVHINWQIVIENISWKPGSLDGGARLRGEKGDRKTGGTA